MSAEALVRTFDSLKLNQTESFVHDITMSDIVTFVELSGDVNPLHTEPLYADTTPYKKPIVHGMYLGSLVSQLIGMKLPGKYAVLLKVALEFKLPAYVGDTVFVQGSVSHKSASTRIITVEIVIECNDRVITTGTAQVLLLK